MTSHTYHIGHATRSKDGKVESYAYNADRHFYTRTAADRALRTIIEELQRRGITIAADDYSIVVREEGKPDRNFDYWRDPKDGLPTEGVRVLLYCESKSPNTAIAALTGDDVPRWIIVIGEWTGAQWTEDRSSKRPPFPVKFWMTLPEEPA